MTKPTDYRSKKTSKAKNEEEAKKPLGIVTEIAAIIFLVSLTDFFSVHQQTWN